MRGGCCLRLGCPSQGSLLLARVAQSHVPLEGVILSIPQKGSLHFMSVKWECSHNYVLRAETSGEATILLG